jgi:hypothetical protein
VNASFTRYDITCTPFAETTKLLTHHYSLFKLRKNSARRDVATGTNTLVTVPHPSENANEIASSIRLSGTQGGIAKAIGQKGRGRG